MTARGAYLDNSLERLTYVAWQTANLSRAQKLPELKSLLRKQKRQKPKPQTPDDMMNILKMVTLALGGKIVKKSDMTEH